MTPDANGPTLRLTGMVENVPGVELEWTLDGMTGAPDDKFLFFDTDGEPRLILSADELIDIRDQAAEEVLGGKSA